MTKIIRHFAWEFALICVFVMKGSLEQHMDRAFLTAIAKVSTHVDQTNIGTSVEAHVKRQIAMMTQIIQHFVREFALTCVFVKKDSLETKMGSVFRTESASLSSNVGQTNIGTYVEARVKRQIAMMIQVIQFFARECALICVFVMKASLETKMGSVFPTESALLLTNVDQTNIGTYVEALAKRQIAMMTQITQCFVRECALICVFVMKDSLEIKMESVFLMASALLSRNVGQTNIETNVETLAKNQTAMMIQNIHESVLSVSDTFFLFSSIKLIF